MNVLVVHFALSFLIAVYLINCDKFCIFIFHFLSMCLFLIIYVYCLKSWLLVFCIVLLRNWIFDYLLINCLLSFLHHFVYLISYDLCYLLSIGLIWIRLSLLSFFIFWLIWIIVISVFIFFIICCLFEYFVWLVLFGCWFSPLPLSTLSLIMLYNIIGVEITFSYQKTFQKLL